MVGGKFAREAHSDSHANGREGRSGRSSTVVRTAVIMVGGKFAGEAHSDAHANGSRGTVGPLFHGCPDGCDHGWWKVRA